MRTERELVVEGPMIPVVGTEVDEEGFAYSRVTGWKYECGCTPDTHHMDCLTHGRHGHVRMRAR